MAYADLRKFYNSVAVFGMGVNWSDDIFGISSMPNQYWQAVKSKILIDFWAISYPVETPNLHDPYV